MPISDAGCARIISSINVKDEALKAFYLSAISGLSVTDYLSAHGIRFVSSQVESTFFSHVLALAEVVLMKLQPVLDSS